MRYDKDKQWVLNVLKSAELSNIINGGMSEPQVGIKKEEDHYKLTARVPGVSFENLDVEIFDKKVIVNHLMYVEQDGQTVQFPKVIAAFPITPNIDFRNITASRVEDELHVILPFNELANGYRKNIDINF